MNIDSLLLRLYFEIAKRCKIAFAFFCLFFCYNSYTYCYTYTYGYFRYTVMANATILYQMLYKYGKRYKVIAVAIDVADNKTVISFFI